MRLELANAEARCHEAARELQNVEARVAQLSEARELAEQLADIRGRGPELSSQLADIEHQQEALASHRTSLDEQITETGRREHTDEAARKEFTLARQNFDRRERELKDSRDRFQAAAAEAEFDPEPARMTVVERELSTRLDDLTRRLPSIHAAPFLVTLLGDIAARLRQAEQSGLAEEVLLPGDSDRKEYTIRAWREICEREAGARAAEGLTETAQNIEAEIAQVRRRLQLLAHAKQVRIRLEQAVTNRDRAARRQAEAIKHLPPDEAITLDQLVSAREEAEAHLAELAERHAAIRHALNLLGGGIDEASLRNRLARICDALGVPESRVRSELVAYQERAVAAQAVFASCQLSADTARRMVKDSAGTVNAAFLALRERPDLAFALKAGGDLLAAAGTSETDQAAALGFLRGAMEAAAQEARAAVE